jgi:capsular exopolysaccharide synthesis family protein
MTEKNRPSLNSPGNRPGAPSSRPRTPAAAATRVTIDPVRVLRQHVIGILVSVIIGGGLGTASYFVLLRWFPKFSSEIYFEVRPGLKDATEIGTRSSLFGDDVDRVAHTQTKLIRQRDVIEQAILDPSVRNTVWLQTDFIDPGSGQPQVQLAADELEKDLWTPVYRETNLFSLAWSAANPADVPKVLNAIAKIYTQKIKQLDERQFSENETLFEDQLRRTRHALQDLRDEIQGFIVAKGITTLDDPRYSQTATEVENLTSSLTESMNDLTSSESQYMQTASKLEGTIEPTAEDVLEADQDPSIYNQIQLLESLRAEERALRERFHPGSKPIQQIQSSINGTQQQIEAKRNELLKRNLNARLKTWSSEMTRLKSLINRIESDLEEKDERLRNLASDASLFESYVAQRSLLEKQRDEQLNLMNSVSLMKLRADAGRVRQVGAAKFPRDVSFPQPEVIIPAGVVICLGLYVMYIFLRALTDQRVHTPSDLLVIPGTRLLGVIPDTEEDPTMPDSAELIHKEHPDSVMAESYRQAWNAIWRSMSRQGHTSLMFASGMPGSGTTTVLSNLALSASASGLRVAIVDGNFRKPRLASIFGIEDDQPGLGDLLSGNQSVDDVVQSVDGVSIIPAGTPVSRVYEKFNDPSLSSIMADLRNRYDCVLVDAAPAVAAGDAMVLANRVESVAVVVRAGHEARGLISRMIGQFGDTQADLMGVILNRPRQTAGGYFKKNYRLMAKYTEIEE